MQTDAHIIAGRLLAYPIPHIENNSVVPLEAASLLRSDCFEIAA